MISMNHVKILKGCPSKMPPRCWDNCCTNHLRKADFKQGQGVFPLNLSTWLHVQLQGSELFLYPSLFEFRFTVFFTLGFGLHSWIPNLQFFQTVAGKAPKEAWGGHLGGEGINVTFLHPHGPQLSAMRCVILNQIDSTYMICVRSCVFLRPHSTLSSPLPFRYDKISRKGQVFRSLVRSGFIRKLFEV